MYRFYRPATGTAEADHVSEVLTRGALSTGALVEKFEKQFATYVGVDNAVAVSSGSIALELALDASQLSAGDLVLVSPFNCTAVLYAIRRSNLHPVFPDIDPETYNLDPSNVATILENRPAIAGLVLTPTYGLAEDINALQELAGTHDLTVVNDFCQAPGAQVDDIHASMVGDVGVCSFGATKPITTGEGGMVTTNDPDIAESVRQSRSNSGVDRERPPSNVQMSDIEAAIGITQLERYPDLLDRRRDVAVAYHDSLPSVVSPQVVPKGYGHVYHRFSIRAPDRDRLLEYLKARGVETSVGITKPLSEFKCVESEQDVQYPETERLLEEYLLLPMHPELEPGDARTIAELITAYYR